MGRSGHPLSGADHFHLLIDRQMRQRGLTGNISRFHLYLAPTADLHRLAETLRKDPTLIRVAGLRLQHRWPFVPRWMEIAVGVEAVHVRDGITAEEFSRTVLNAPVRADACPVRIDLCRTVDGLKHLVVSMHHALFDHRGMMLFLRSLADGTQSVQFFLAHTEKKWTVELADAVRGMFAALGSGGWRLATLSPRSTRMRGPAAFQEIAFSGEETSQSDLAAQQAGSRPGRSAFYLAATLMAVRELLEARGQRPPYFWVPVPHDMRRKGGTGHLVGNDLSFLFFKVMRDELDTVEKAVESIQGQLTAQVRKGSLRHQAAVQRVFRYIPLWLMSAMVGLTTGGRVSTLAFSDLGEERDPVTSFRGERVERMMHIPPVPFPPGLSVVFLREKGVLRIVLGTYAEVVSSDELSALAQRISALLR